MLRGSYPRSNRTAFDTSLPNEKAGAAVKIDKRLRIKGAFMLASLKQFIVKDMKGLLAEDVLEQAEQWAMEIKKTCRMIGNKRTA